MMVAWRLKSGRKEIKKKSSSTRFCRVICEDKVLSGMWVTIKWAKEASGLRTVKALG